ncbi:TPA: hypothetical protein ACFP37_001102 [Neisseria subflava]|nr:hypothetical protein [uncultured Neisseria sp.]
MFAKVSADLDGNAVFCRNGAVKRILCHANMNNGRLKFFRRPCVEIGTYGLERDLR